MAKEIESGEYIFGEYIFGEYTIAYEGKGFKLFEFINEGNKAIMFISNDMSGIIGYFVYEEEKKTVFITYLFAKSYKISDKRIEVVFLP